MTANSNMDMHAGISIEKRDRECADKIKVSVSDIINCLSAIENAAEQQKALGLGNPAPALDGIRKRIRTQTLKAQADELAAVFSPVECPDPRLVPRVEKFTDQLPRLPEYVICQIRPGMTHVRCTVPLITLFGTSIMGWIAKRYEAPLPVVPSTVLELSSRARMICPDIEFHLVLKPSWTEALQLDPILLGKVPEVDEYFEIGAWDGDATFMSELVHSREIRTT
jgi:hypothetical protein